MSFFYLLLTVHCFITLSEIRPTPLKLAELVGSQPESYRPLGRGLLEVGPDWLIGVGIIYFLKEKHSSGYSSTLIIWNMHEMNTCVHFLE